MDLITIDLESYYDKDYSLTKITTEEYIRSALFEVIGLGVKVNDGSTEWASGSHAALRKYLQKFDWANAMVLAHNTLFDGAILGWHFGVKPKIWADTLSMGRALHGVEVGGSLRALAERYKLGEKGTEVLKALGKRRADFTEEELSRYGDYCVNDVELTYQLFNRMVRNFPKQELRVIDQTLRMFIEPVLELDKDLLHQHLAETRERKGALLASCGVDKAELMSNQKFAEVLTSLGVTPPMKVSPTTGRDTYAFAKSDEAFKALAEHPDDRVQALVAARLGTKSTLEETRTQRFIEIAGRGVMPIPIRYYAAHTGRFGGDDKVNMQNLPSRGADANKLKKSIKAPEGHSIIDCDSAQIEARVLAWLAGQEDLITAFAEGKDVYKKMASAIYGKPEYEIDKQERFVGKCVVLGCFGPDTQVLTHVGWKRIVDVHTTDTLWDGEEWVSHQGVIPQGEKEVTTAYGVSATADHEILTEHGWREWSEVATNLTLFQSAISRAHLPLSIGHRISAPWGGLQGGTLLSGAGADGKVELTDITSRWGALRGATRALEPQGHRPVRIFGGMKVLSPTPPIEYVYLTAWPVAFLAATQRLISNTLLMEGAGYGYTPRGGLVNETFYCTYSHLKGGTIRQKNLTGLTTIEGMSRVICDLLHAAKMFLTAEQSMASKQKLMTYDIALAGPRNRYTVATTAGPIIVHNCGYGMGAQKFKDQLKVFGTDIELDESRRIVDIYRRTNDQIKRIWVQAQNVLHALVMGGTAPLGRPGVLEIVPSECAIRFPSGLLMRYTDLSFTESDKGIQFQYMTRKGPSRIYGGKVIENVCQGLARCIIAEQMLKIGQRYKVVLTVHDAVACVVRDAEVEEAKLYVEECMRWTPAWATGLPLNCESGVGKSYGDC